MKVLGTAFAAEETPAPDLEHQSCCISRIFDSDQGDFYFAIDRACTTQIQLVSGQNTPHFRLCDEFPFPLYNYTIYIISAAPYLRNPQCISAPACIYTNNL